MSTLRPLTYAINFIGVRMNLKLNSFSTLTYHYFFFNVKLINSAKKLYSHKEISGLFVMQGEKRDDQHTTHPAFR